MKNNHRNVCLATSSCHNRPLANSEESGGQFGTGKIPSLVKLPASLFFFFFNPLVAAFLVKHPQQFRKLKLETKVECRL